MNRELGKPIALGRTAEIYSWGDGHILKLFYDWFDLDSIQYEQRINRAVHATGLPIPAVGEILQVNGHNGLVYQRVDGVPMWEALGKRPWLLIRFARQMAELHAEMHASPIQPDLPFMRQRLEHKIRGADPLPAPLKHAALAALASLPEGDRLCHGDFHPQNILITNHGPLIIDWIDASLGSPLADVARTSIIILGAAASSQIPSRFRKAFARLSHALYLRRYFRLRPGGKDEYRRWLPVIAAARLSEGMPELEGWLVAQARGGPAGSL